MMRCTLPISARRSVLALSTLALIGSLTACGGDDDAGAEDTTVRISYFPLVHTATAVNAAEAGLFEEEGVDVELLPSAGGAQAIPSLMAGDYDVTYTNYSSAIVAAQQGLPIVFVAGNDVGASDHGIYVAADSSVEEVADLSGKTFAVNNLQNIGTVAIKAQLEEAGADPDSIQLVEMPYPDMLAALDRGDVDAIWQVEPFQASAEAAGMRKLGDLFAGPVADMPVAGWVTTREFAQENPEAITAVQDALAASAEDLRDDREQIVDLVPTYTEMDAAVVEAVVLPEWSSELDGTVLQEMTDLMEQYGVISEPFDVETMMP